MELDWPNQSRSGTNLVMETYRRLPARTSLQATARKPCQPAKENLLRPVKVSWFRPDEGDLRLTTLRQKWHDYSGDWKLTHEERIDGDLGLIGETIPGSDKPREPTQHAQFPTIRIGAPE